MSVRVRFAPSPTGRLHVGALRTALFDYLFAQHNGGVNVLRIEDTDRNRYQPEAEKEFLDALAWAGVRFDEGPHVGGDFGPYRQSERKEAGVYAPLVERLLAEGHAYKAFETPEELERMRTAQQAEKSPIGYFGGAWRDATPAEVARAEAAGKDYVVRLRIPRNETIRMRDAVRGEIEWDSNLVDDPVLIKKDGMPTYHFAAMVDDHLMRISHVIRGEEWISSAPKHVVLYQAFGWELPVMVHCPVITGPDGKKLSKRHGATSVLDYRSMGILPEALMNFVALIGWSPGGDREVMSPEELIEAFSLEGLQPSPGRFDFEKLLWLNGHRIRSMSPSELRERLLEYVASPGLEEFWGAPREGEAVPGLATGDVFARLSRIPNADAAYVERALVEVQPRVSTLADIGEALEFFLVEEPPMDEKAAAKWLAEPHVPQMFAWFLEELPNTDGTAAAYEAMLRAYQERAGLEKLGPVVHPTRVALTGKTSGPGLFELMEVLGKDRVAARLRKVLDR